VQKYVYVNKVSPKKQRQERDKEAGGWVEREKSKTQESDFIPAQSGEIILNLLACFSSS
jgi:hypothetical protein